MGFQITFFCYNPCPPRQRATGSLGNSSWFGEFGEEVSLPSHSRGTTWCLPPLLQLSPNPHTYPSTNLLIPSAFSLAAVSNMEFLPHSILLPRILLSSTILIFSLPLEKPKCPTHGFINHISWVATEGIWVCESQIHTCSFTHFQLTPFLCHSKVSY